MLVHGFILSEVQYLDYTFVKLNDSSLPNFLGSAGPCEWQHTHLVYQLLFTVLHNMKHFESALTSTILIFND